MLPGKGNLFARFTYNGDSSLASEEESEEDCRKETSTFTWRFVYNLVRFLCKLSDPFLEHEIDGRLRSRNGYREIGRVDSIRRRRAVSRRHRRKIFNRWMENSSGSDYTTIWNIYRKYSTLFGNAKTTPSSSDHPLDIHWTYWWYALISRIISNGYPVTIRMSCLMTIFSGYWCNRLFLSRKRFTSTEAWTSYLGIVSPPC